MESPLVGKDLMKNSVGSKTRHRPSANCWKIRRIRGAF